METLLQHYIVSWEIVHISAVPLQFVYDYIYKCIVSELLRLSLIIDGGLEVVVVVVVMVAHGGMVHQYFFSISCYFLHFTTKDIIWKKSMNMEDQSNVGCWVGQEDNFFSWSF